MRVAHVRERYAPAGTAFRLAAAFADDRWLDLERARRVLIRLDPELAHNVDVFRRPITTLDALLASGARVEALRAILEPMLDRHADAVPAGDPDGLRTAGADAGRADDADDGLWLDESDLAFGPPILAPRSIRDFYAFERHVATAWALRGGEVPEAWYRLPVFYFSNVSEIRGPGDQVWAPRGSSELDYELEIAALIDTPARDLPLDGAEAAIGGYTIFNDWSARDLQRDETPVRLGPAKGKDFASSIGPWLVTPDELDDTRHGKGFALAETATVNGREISRGSWSSIHYSFGEMLARASADARLVPGDLVCSGTVGTGCLLEMRAESGFGRYLRPGDIVTLAIDRLGELTTPIVEHPE